jgi:multiple sugar transport system substrate-binding protein
MASLREITRRSALAAIAGAGLGFAVFGPRGSRDAGKGRIVLEYWEKWTRHEGEAMRRVVDAFNDSQNRIFVRYIVVTDIGQKSLVAIAGGDPPDVIGLYAFNIPPYAEAGALMHLDELAPSHAVSLDDYAEGVRQIMLHKGRWWGIVNTAGSVALYYNRTAFRDAGLDPNRPPRTISELDDYHTRLVRRGPGGRLEQVGFFHPEPGWWSWLWAYHFGGRIYDPTQDRSLVDSPENIRAMEWMQTYPHTLGLQACKAFKEGFGNYFTPENPFLTGKVAMIVQGPWVANLVEAFKPDLDYAVAPFPVADGLFDAASPIGLIDTDVLVIPRGARHPDASMEFIAFTQRRDMVEMLARAHCKPSPLARTSPDFVRTHPNRGIGVHYDIFRSARAFIAPPTRVWQQFKDEFDSAVQRLWRLEERAAPAMTALQRRTQSLIDRARAQYLRRYGEGA